MTKIIKRFKKRNWNCHDERHKNDGKPATHKFFKTLLFGNIFTRFFLFICFKPFNLHVSS